MIDSPEIELNFTKHMIYLTQNLQQNQIKRNFSNTFD